MFGDILGRPAGDLIQTPTGWQMLWPDHCVQDMVVADLDASLLERCTGRRWIRTRRPDLYTPLTIPTGLEQDTRTVRFDKKLGV